MGFKSENSPMPKLLRLRSEKIGMATPAHLKLGIAKRNSSSFFMHKPLFIESASKTRFSPYSHDAGAKQFFPVRRYLYSILPLRLSAFMFTRQTGKSVSLNTTALSCFQLPSSGQLPHTAMARLPDTLGTFIDNCKILPASGSVGSGMSALCSTKPCVNAELWYILSMSQARHVSRISVSRFIGSFITLSGPHSSRWLPLSSDTKYLYEILLASPTLISAVQTPFPSWFMSNALARMSSPSSGMLPTMHRCCPHTVR